MKHAEFRFYEELNDFLPRARQKVAFTFEFVNTCRVVDAIEMLGVPHTEVDLIIANGKSVDFKYILQDQDRVAVYPVFESIDISQINHLRPRPLRKTKFILDVHLGRLAKYMRMCGFDCVYEDLNDDEIIAKALEEKRIILTKDRGLLKNKKVTHGYWVRSTNPKEQLIEILRRFDLFKKINLLTRCLVCNSPLETVPKNDIKHLLTAHTAGYYNKFYICRPCNKIYWEGSHYDNMLQLINSLITEASEFRSNK